MIKKEVYIAFTEIEKSIPLFMQPLWLDAVCTEGVQWDVALSFSKNQEINGVLCYCYKKKYGFTIITMPPLTKFTGIWIRPANENLEHEKRNYEQDILKNLIEQLPKTHFITLYTHYALTDWSPFYWAGFDITTAYTQVLEDMTDRDSLFKNLNRDIKKNIKKADAHLKVVQNADFQLFMNLNNQIYQRQNISNPIPLSIWQRVDAAMSKKNQRDIYFSMDEKGEAQGTVYIVRDAHTAYVLASGTTEGGRQYGAMSQLIWQAISDNVGRVKTFDFLGSMLPQIEPFNRRFNTVKKPYFRLSKYKYRFLSFFK